MKHMHNLTFGKIIKGSGVEVRHAVEVGAFSMEFCNLGHYLLDPKVRVQLFEPMPERFASLSKETAGLEHVTCHNVAIMDEDGPVVMRNMWAGSHVVGVAAPEVVNKGTKTAAFYRGKKIEEVTVEGRIFTPFDDGTIDVLTLDSEGCEWFVLKHMRSLPKWISIEMGDSKNPYKNPNSAEIHQWMEKNRYRVHGTIVDRDTIWSRL